ncbi:hypothetical protein L596_010968 [Steinernema carpocapsae]|uniref:Uncharacterized protein n=1 Tax=Steinernema carpocapsae TaxID=34508 RepID=A0A4U5NSU3_STECR|nr:hypothetical protein L596_010968 [Steinernema carpocapsae]
MYKIHNALSRSTIPTLSLQKSVVVSKSSTTRQPELFLGSKKASQSNEEKFFNSVHSFDISKVWLNRPQPMRYENIPAQKSVDPELVKALDDAWTNFVTDQATGKPDENIVTYSNSEPSTIPEDFVPLDVDKFMAKQILATLNIDLAVLN